MPSLETQGISLYYELHGEPSAPPVLLITGLGGVGKNWGEQVQRFADRHYVVLPDQRGTGQTTHAQDGYTTQQLADDMAALVEHLGLGPVHVVGASTGGAIGQYLALEHAEIVRSLTVSSSFARFDPFVRRQFEIRRKMAAEWDRHTLMRAYSLFLLGPRFTHDHPNRVASGSNELPLAPAARLTERSTSSASTWSPRTTPTTGLARSVPRPWSPAEPTTSARPWHCLKKSQPASPERNWSPSMTSAS